MRQGDSLLFYKFRRGGVQFRFFEAQLTCASASGLQIPTNRLPRPIKVLESETNRSDQLLELSLGERSTFYEHWWRM